MIEGQEMVVSNLGDCRAVLSRGGIAEAITKVHRAGRERAEKNRGQGTSKAYLETLQGRYVELHRGTWRAHGILSVSRSVGDVHLKDWVWAEPDTKNENNGITEKLDSSGGLLAAYKELAGLANKSGPSQTTSNCKSDIENQGTDHRVYAPHGLHPNCKSGNKSGASQNKSDAKNGNQMQDSDYIPTGPIYLNSNVILKLLNLYKEDCNNPQQYPCTKRTTITSSNNTVRRPLTAGEELLIFTSGLFSAGFFSSSSSQFFGLPYFPDFFSFPACNFIELGDEGFELGDGSFLRGGGLGVLFREPTRGLGI
ncbi:unnamed protein product [Fraxinus pennsylvanica]|uniref:PPM-type phosphatase domain-containing protein n=1 Tax=Fraxinus pennsylvanica TaxID=56036 RepID=A0AAD2A678_9LAMI|nr:unnamed protein product [Fraxinus pennsylvanica]